MALTGDDNYKIVISTTADGKGAKDTERAIKDLGDTTDKSSGSFFKMASAVAAGEAAFALAKNAIVKVAGFLGDTIKSANDSENAMAQLNSVLASTKGAAGVTADQLNKQASALQKMTTFSDEAISSAQSLLLTFTNVKGKVFEDSIPVILDMSQALGQDLKSSSIQLGKALNDPIKGITALSRVGVSFTEKQKETIAKLVETGKTAEAQRVILKELNTEFGGSAAAAGKTFAGSMERLKNQMDDVKESIGQTMVNALTPFTQKAADFISSIDWEDVINRSKEALKGFAKRLDEVWWAIDKVYQKVEAYLQPKLEALWHTIRDDLAPQLEKLWRNVIEPLIPVIGTLFVGAIGLAIDAFNFLLDAVTSTLNWMEHHTWVVATLATVFGSLAAAMALGAAFDAITVGFATLTLVTIPSFMASLEQAGAVFVAAFPFAIVIAGIVAIGVEIAKVISAYGNLQKEQEKAQKAQDSLNKQMDDQINKGKLTLDQAYKIQNAAGYTGNKTVSYDKKSNTYLPGFASGGFTGQGGENDVAGIVHKGEFVVPKAQVDQSTGKPKMGGVVFNQTNHIYNDIDLKAANREIGFRLANA